MDFKRILRTPMLWIVVLIGAAILVLSLSDNGGFTRIDTSKALDLVNTGKVDSAKLINNERMELTLKQGESFSDGDKVKNATKVYAYYVTARGTNVVAALDAHVPPNGYTDQIDETNWFGSMLVSLIPIIIVLGLFWFLMGQMQGGGSRVMQFGKSRAKLASKDTPKVTFADVAGCDEAVEELHEIKEFLQEPAKFLAVGAKIPKGVLLYGQPGTGKTLLARAVAGEAGVPFYSISGSDFVEMFVGVGASRVRDLFEQAKANAPAIVFVDEIDAVGRHRGAGLGGGHDEREQTLNQLLVEMDGFDVKTNVILIAATNRPDILDPALLRPGRFDRQIAVDTPDMLGRNRILQVHSQGKPMAPDVDLLAVARRTPGFTGADLANVLNEAALLTARTNKKLIDDHTLDEAIDRVIAGPQKRTRIMSAAERKMTAYHEGGHALVAASLNHTDPVTKVTILPRGRALGYTMVMPQDDKYSTTRNEILDQLAYALGGRVAEEMVFHDPTTGAANDIEKATAMARKMVTEYGMSERVGAIKLGAEQRRGVPRPRDGPPARLQRGDRRRRRRGGAQAHRERARRGVARHQRQPRRPRPAGPRAAREGDPRLRRAGDDLRRRAQAADTPALALQRVPPAERPPAGADAGRARRDEQRDQRAQRRLQPQWLRPERLPRSERLQRLQRVQRVQRPHAAGRQR